jgi:hypothetical protein
MLFAMKTILFKKVFAGRRLRSVVVHLSMHTTVSGSFVIQSEARSKIKSLFY